MRKLPIIIIGQGLAGTALAWKLLERKIPFLITDRDDPITSSKIAAGLVTPITGMRLNFSWRYATFHPEALLFYRKREKILGTRFFHRTPIVTMFRDEKAVTHWEKRRRSPDIARMVRHPEPLVDESVFANPLGGFEQRHSGWLDTAAYLKASRDFFIAKGFWQKASVSPEELDLGEGMLHWRGQPFEMAVFCTGWEAARHPWFDWVPFQSAQGTVLNVSADTGGEKRIINRGCWLLPRGDGTLRVGPTYEWGFADPHAPSPESISGLETKLHALLKKDYQINGAQTAVRPIIKGCEALLGRHPVRPQIAFFNGLGSKGVLRAPWMARHLVEHLLDNKPLDPVLDLAQNLD